MYSCQYCGETFTRSAINHERKCWRNPVNQRGDAAVNHHDVGDNSVVEEGGEELHDEHWDNCDDVHIDDGTSYQESESTESSDSTGSNPEFYHLPPVDLKYCYLQEEMYRQSYSLDALFQSRDLASFLELLPHPFPDKDIAICWLVAFKNSVHLSREGGNQLLHLLNFFAPNAPIPDDWRSILNVVRKKCRCLEGTTLKRTVPWPVSWNMDRYEECGNTKLPEIELTARDPLELLASMLVDPILQYINKDELQYESREETLSDETPCTSGIMSSSFAKYSEREIRAKDPNGILIPIIVYADGVGLGLRNMVYCVVLCIEIYSLSCA